MTTNIIAVAVYINAFYSSGLIVWQYPQEFAVGFSIVYDIDMGIIERIDINRDRKYLILEYINGKRFYKGEIISKKDLETAVSFFKLLNKLFEHSE